jgi:hypothetical protein
MRDEHCSVSRCKPEERNEADAQGDSDDAACEVYAENTTNDCKREVHDDN